MGRASAFVASVTFGVALVARVVQRSRVRRRPELRGGLLTRFGFWAGGVGALLALGVIPATTNRAWGEERAFAILAAMLGVAGLLLLARGEFRNAGERHDLTELQLEMGPARAPLDDDGVQIDSRRRGQWGTDERATRHLAVALWVLSVAWLDVDPDEGSTWVWTTGLMLGIYHVVTTIGYVRFNRAGGGTKLLQVGRVTQAFHIMWFLSLGFWL